MENDIQHLKVVYLNDELNGYILPIAKVIFFLLLCEFIFCYCEINYNKVKNPIR